MKNHTKKTNFLLTLSIILSILLIYLIAYPRKPVATILTYLEMLEKKPSIKNSVKKTEPSLEIENAGYAIASDSSEFEFQDPMRDPSLRREILDWFASRGRFTEDMRYDAQGYRLPTLYETYDGETLRQLGDGGDLRALHALARRADTYEKYNEPLKKAAVYNSTQALGDIGSLFSTRGDNSKSTQEKKTMYMEALAYYAAAQIRGDWTHSMRGGSRLRKNSKVTFTEADDLQIQRRAQEIYDELQSRRYTLGLGDFENSIPEAVMREYEATLAALGRIEGNP